MAQSSLSLTYSISPFGDYICTLTLLLPSKMGKQNWSYIDERFLPKNLDENLELLGESLEPDWGYKYPLSDNYHFRTFKIQAEDWDSLEKLVQEEISEISKVLKVRPNTSLNPLFPPPQLLIFELEN